MTHSVFYSWQSDLPNHTNRSLIEEALESAAKAIRADGTISVEPVVDRDTAGIGGAPEIANTIFDKIAHSAVFVADVSIINLGARKRRVPNPNVLIELGFALRALGAERVVMVMNASYGKPDLLPFDLKLRRVMTYTSNPGESSREATHRDLAARLETELRTILTTSPTVASEVDALHAAVRFGSADRKLIAREYLHKFYDRLFVLAPSPAPKDDAELVTSLERTTSLIIEFGKLAEAVAIAEDVVVAEAMYDSFGKILARYDHFSGSALLYETAFDFYRFLGHELFVSFVAALLQEKQLAILKRLLARDLDVPAPHRLRIRSFHDLQRGTSTLWERSKRLNLMSAQGALLRERHTEGAPAATVPFDHFLGADYFLFLYVEAKNSDDNQVPWFPPTAPYLSQSSTFLTRLHRNDFAIEVATTFGLRGSDELRKLIADSEVKLARAFGLDWTRIPEAFNPSLIGSR